MTFLGAIYLPVAFGLIFTVAAAIERAIYGPHTTDSESTER